MHLSYSIDEEDLVRGGRARIIEDAVSAFRLNEPGGELSLLVSNESYGDALFDYVQALFKVTDVTYLTRERILTVAQMLGGLAIDYPHVAGANVTHRRAARASEAAPDQPGLFADES